MKKAPKKVTKFFRAPPAIICEQGEKTQNVFRLFFKEKLEKTNTSEAYGLSLMRFLSWCANERIALDQITHNTMRSYRDRLDSQFSPSYVNLQLSAINSLFDWLVEHECLQSNPSTRVRSKGKIAPASTPSLTSDQVSHLFSSLKGSNAIVRRDRAMIALMMHSFAATETLVRLNHQDYIWRDNSRWFSFGRDKQVRLVPANSIVRDCMTDYLAQVPKPESSTTPLFPILSKNKPGEFGRRMTVRNVQRIVKMRAKKAGLDQSITPRMLRATGLRLFFEMGGSLEIGKKAAGHASYITTALYSREQPSQLLYEGDLDGLVDMLSDSASGPLGEYIRQSGIFQLTIRQREEENTP